MSTPRVEVRTYWSACVGTCDRCGAAHLELAELVPVNLGTGKPMGHGLVVCDDCHSGASMYLHVVAESVLRDLDRLQERRLARKRRHFPLA